jgi:PucR C-terminal helix-turn-helix domain/GGDEF-like domain
MNRIRAVGEPRAGDPIYAEGLKAAVVAAIDYGLAAIELGERRSPPPPPILFAQARVAARAGVRLDTVLRRYVAGNTLVVDFLLEEAERLGLEEGAALQGLMRAQSTLFDRLLAAVAEEHRRESDCHASSFAERRRERVERLLAGELLDSSDLGYELEASHLGLTVRGRRVEEGMRQLAKRLDRRLLAVRRENEPIWACWLGGRRALDPGEAQGALAELRLPNLRIAIGEPGEGLAGWRLTHRQAEAALPIALRGSEPSVCYADVALLASMLQDELLCSSLRDMYLRPLERERDGGRMLRETLRAYFGAGRRALSAASVLGVNRNTVTRRLRAVEVYVGRSLASFSAEYEAALRLEQILELSPAGTVPQARDRPLQTA